MEYNGKGPLLSARAIDLDVLWKRAEQIKDVCVEVRAFSSQLSFVNPTIGSKECPCLLCYLEILSRTLEGSSCTCMPEDHPPHTDLQPVDEPLASNTSYPKRSF